MNRAARSIRPPPGLLGDSPAALRASGGYFQAAEATSHAGLSSTSCSTSNGNSSRFHLLFARMRPLFQRSIDPEVSSDKITPSQFLQIMYDLRVLETPSTNRWEQQKREAIKAKGGRPGTGSLSCAGSGPGANAGAGADSDTRSLTLLRGACLDAPDSIELMMQRGFWSAHVGRKRDSEGAGKPPLLDFRDCTGWATYFYGRKLGRAQAERSVAGIGKEGATGHTA